MGAAESYPPSAPYGKETAAVKKKKTLKKILLTLVALCLLAGLALAVMNLCVLAGTKDRILTLEEAAKLEDVDCVLVLGCGLRRDGTPSQLLDDRILTGVRVYETGVTDRILMSGDHGRKSYDEVNAMKTRAANSGIPAGNIFCDHAGFSTYESMYRALDIFGADKIIIVTQSYHLSRAVYDARRLGIDAYGVAATGHAYQTSLYREGREFLARAKDVIWCVFKPEPTYRGEKIPITGDGSLTDG